MTSDLSRLDLLVIQIDGLHIDADPVLVGYTRHRGDGNKHLLSLLGVIEKARRLLRNLARRLKWDAPSVAASNLEELDEMLTVNRLGLPAKLRRSLACTNSVEDMMGTMRRVCCNVK
jgi:hypothetical protein